VPFIERLVAGGVMSGRPDGSLDPKGDVTRAEFTKMIVGALKIQPGTNQKAFSDVGEADWYKQFVDIASSRDLINGISEGVFAPDNKITRQDLCTIAYRALIGLGVALPASDGTVFPDGGSIADYAKDAVSMLKQLGIVSGRDSGAFDPFAFATREETAKIICGIMDVAAAPAAAPDSGAEADAPADSDSTTEGGITAEGAAEETAEGAAEAGGAER
jgi:hypothetical protein